MNTIGKIFAGIVTGYILAMNRPGFCGGRFV